MNHQHDSSLSVLLWYHFPHKMNSINMYDWRNTQWWQTSGQSSGRTLQLLREPNEVLMEVKGGRSQSRSSSYSAVVTDREPQVDVMSLASLLSCLLPLHNWSQINVIPSSDGGERKKKRERRGEKKPPTLTRPRALKKKTNGGTILSRSVCTELRRCRGWSQLHDMRLHDVWM